MIEKLNKKIYGVLIGIIIPISIIWLILYIFSAYQKYPYQVMLNKFFKEPSIQSKIITLSVIINLVSFYFFLNKKKNEAATGVIIATILFSPYIIYLKFIV